MTKAITSRQTPVNGSIKLVLDRHPIKLAGFHLHARGIRPVGKPTLEEWTTAMQIANGAHEASTYWVGALLAYADDRTDWANKLDQAVGLTGMAHQTALNATYIVRHVQEAEREIAQSPAHAMTVAALTKPEQSQWLGKSRDEGWTVADLRKYLRASKRARVLDTQAIVEGLFRVILAEPKWSDGVERLCKLPLGHHTGQHSVLFLWVPPGMLLASPGPRDVMEAWGYVYQSNVVWSYVLGGESRFLKLEHEHLLIGTRGDCDPTVSDEHSVVTIRRPYDSTDKPMEFSALIERMYPEGPYLHLGAMERRKDWTAWDFDPTTWKNQTSGQ